jgi:hypothetical protein
MDDLLVCEERVVDGIASADDLIQTAGLFGGRNGRGEPCIPEHPLDLTCHVAIELLDRAART